MGDPGGRVGAGYAGPVSETPDAPGVPRPVQGAGLMVAAQGLVAVVVGAWLGISAMGAPGPTGLQTTLATVVWFVGSAAVLLAIGINLVRGRHGARSPAVVAQILLLGVCWYALGPSSQPAYGVLGGVFCVVVLVLLFCPPAVRWAAGRPLPGADDDADDAVPGGADRRRGGGVNRPGTPGPWRAD